MNDDILWKIDSEIGKNREVVKLRRKNEELINENDYLKRKCSEMGIALKNYEKGRYQEHLENEQLHSIINEARKLAKERIKDVGNMSYVEMSSKAYIKEQQEFLEILDKVEEKK